MSPQEILEQRLAVAKEAKTWEFTPFENNQCVKGAGVDCAWFIAETFNKTLRLNIKPPAYAWQWYVNSHEELYLDNLTSNGFIELPENAKLPGDLLLVRMERVCCGGRLRTINHYCHAAVILNWPKVIHAEARGNAVITVNAECDWYFDMREIKYFSWGGWHEDV